MLNFNQDSRESRLHQAEPVCRAGYQRAVAPVKYCLIRSKAVWRLREDELGAGGNTFDRSGVFGVPFIDRASVATAANPPFPLGFGSGESFLGSF